MRMEMKKVRQSAATTNSHLYCSKIVINGNNNRSLSTIQRTIFHNFCFVSLKSSSENYYFVLIWMSLLLLLFFHFSLFQFYNVFVPWICISFINHFLFHFIYIVLCFIHTKCISTINRIHWERMLKSNEKLTKKKSGSSSIVKWSEEEKKNRIPIMHSINISFFSSFLTSLDNFIVMIMTMSIQIKFCVCMGSFFLFDLAKGECHEIRIFPTIIFCLLSQHGLHTSTKTKTKYL